MTKIQELKKYLNYEFSSGFETGEDYKIFQRKYINYLNTLCKENNWELVKANKNHYEFSAFLKYGNNYIYIAINDVRYYKNDWYNHVLFRTAKTSNDYIGGTNLYTTLPLLKLAILNLFNKGF